MWLWIVTVAGFGQSLQEAPEIVEISIEGNHHLTQKELLRQLSLEEKRIMNKGSFFNKHHLAREIQKLENYYTLHGFLDAEITDSLALNEDNSIEIYLMVTEGKEYYLRDVTLTGNRIFSDVEYLDLIEYQAGSSFNTFKIRENLLEMLALYKDSGYPLINIQDSVVVDDSVSLYIQVIEGPKLNISAINIVAPEHIPASIISREIIVQVGDMYKLTNIEESKRRLYETSLFNSVNIRPGVVDLDLKTIELDVEVIAAKFKGFDMNFGLKQARNEAIDYADPVLSLGLSGRWYNNNLFDTSRRIQIQTNISSIFPAILTPQQLKFDFLFVEPWLDKYRIPLTINPFFWYVNYVDNDNKENDFTNTAYGLRGILTYRWFRKIKIQTLTEWSQSVTITENDSLVSDGVYKEERKVGLRFIWDERNNFFYPSDGFKLVIEPGLVGYFFGGDNSYLQLQASISSYWKIFNNVVFAHNLNIAVAKVGDQSTVIPYEKRYFLGGSSSIRGYDQQALGPQGEFVSLGGNIRYFTNFELRFPIYKILGGEVFMDVGNLWSDLESAELTDYYMAVGAGLTIDTPIGPARIDYGIPIGDARVTNNGQIHIAIAYAF